MYLKNIILNAFIFAITVGTVLVAHWFDGALGWPSYASLFMKGLGTIAFVVGFFFRFWATGLFYKHAIAVLRPDAQRALVTDGPYRWTRNPLYVGIVALTLGCALILGSYAGLIATVLVFLVWDFWIRFHEEKTLEKAFGEQYREYTKRTPRWL